RRGVLRTDTEARVTELALDYAARMATAPGGVVLVGNGEPRIVVGRGQGRCGRDTHLALLIDPGLSGRGPVGVLLAGTDERDGSAPASGAVVDGETWGQALAAGLDPQGAL